MRDNHGTPPLYENQPAYIRPFVYNERLFNNRQQKTPDITLCMLEMQDKITNTLPKVQHQSTTDRYMNDLKTCIGHNAEEFSSWLLSVEKVSTLANCGPKEFCFKKQKEILKSFTL